MTPLPATPEAALSLRHRARVMGWGQAVSGYSQLLQPVSLDELAGCFDLARQCGRPLALRGMGRSYGDAALNTDGFVLSTAGLNRILEWDAQAGVIAVEPGVTIGQLWRHTLPAGWWPPVVSGTQHVSLGGAASANIHGKNNWRMGPLGEHIRSFDLLTPAGERLTCSREHERALFHAAIGGFGLLGVMTRIELQLKRVHSGYLQVEPVSTATLPAMLALMAEQQDTADYMVGWVDCLAGGAGLGRGLVHLAWYLPEGADPEPAESLRIKAQEPHGRIAGLVPRWLAPMLARPFLNPLGVWLVNAAKYWSGRWGLRGYRYWETHASFAFLLDSLPEWRSMYLPGGLIQYQVFIPKEHAARVFRYILQRCLDAGLPGFLGVVKRHRPDPFLLSHAVDGFSLALDFKVTAANRAVLWHLLRSFDGPVLDHGGRFYFAKDLTLLEDRIPRLWPPESLAAFGQHKERCDPDHLLQTDLSRRLLPEWS